jgi:hypothetical protein
MSTDEESEGRQRTVAELLQQYGDGGGRASRRRRRAADDEEPAERTGERVSAAELLDRDQPRTGASRAARGSVESTTRGTPAATRDNAARDNAARDSAAESTGGTPAATRGGSVESTTRGTAAVPRQRWDSGVGYGQSVDPLTGEPIDPPDRGGPPTSPGISPGSGTGAYPSGRTRVGRSDPPTEQLPRYPDAGPMTGPLTGPVTGPLGWGAARNRPDPDDDGPPTGQLSRADDDVSPGQTDTQADQADQKDASPLAGAAPAGLAERDDRGEFADEPEGPLGAVGWLKLIGQWLIGAVLGALLWVGFSWLWTNHPVIALVAAVLATAGLVLLVRAIRRSDDLQTTMLAVLVGLVVTISPAVLLLANR